MAFDPEYHIIHPENGFQVHKDTGHRIGLDSAPHARVTDETEWPKWVKPHDSHVHQQGDHISTPHFPQHHVDRATSEVTVLVHTPEEEAHALAEAVAIGAAEIAVAGV
jgi:hypothetical protein